MALQKIIKNGTETGNTAADKINAIVDEANAHTSDIIDIDAVLAPLPAAVATNTSDITANAVVIASNIVDIAANTADLVTLKNTGLLSLVKTTPIVLPLVTTYTLIEFAETINIDKSNGCFSYDAGTKVLTVLKNGVYNLAASGSIYGANGARTSFTYFINGVDLLPGAAPEFTTTGANKPVAISDHRYLELLTNDTIDIRAKVDAAIDITLVASSLSIEKTTF